MASPTQWTWVWLDSGSWWCTGRPGVLQFMGSQRVRHDWATELNWTELIYVNTTLPIRPTLPIPSRDLRETSKLSHISVGEGEGLSYFQGWRITGDCHYHAFIKWRFPRRSLMIHLGQYNSLWGSSPEHYWFSLWLFEEIMTSLSSNTAYWFFGHILYNMGIKCVLTCRVIAIGFIIVIWFWKVLSFT